MSDDTIVKLDVVLEGQKQAISALESIGRAMHGMNVSGMAALESLNSAIDRVNRDSFKNMEEAARRTALAVAANTKQMTSNFDSLGMRTQASMRVIEAATDRVMSKLGAFATKDTGMRLLSNTLTEDAGRMNAAYRALETVSAKFGTLATKDNGIRLLAVRANEDAEALRAAYTKLEKVANLKDTIRARLGTGGITGSTAASKAVDSTAALGAMREYYLSQGATSSYTASSAAGGVLQAETLARTASQADKLNSSFKRLTISGNDLHSMARGLASGFGLLWLTWGNLIPLLAGAAISTSVAKALSLGAKFNENLAATKELAGATSADIAMLTSEMFKLGASTPYGPIALSEGLKVLTLAGLSAKDAMLALKPTMDFALAGGVTTEKAAETLVAVSTAYGYAADQMSVVGDVVAKTAAVSMTSVDQMSESFKVASTVAQQFGVSLQDSALQLAFLSQIGITGQAAGTAMTNYYTGIVIGTKASRTALKELGVTVTDSTGMVKDAATVTSDLYLALSTKTVEHRNKLIGDLTTNRGLKDLSAQWAAFNKTILELNPAEAAHIKSLEAQGNAAEAAALKAELATTQFKKFQDQIADAPGFTAIAAAGMALTPENQFKGLKASLETDLVQAFQAVSDQLFVLGDELRTTFNSDSFQEAIVSMVRGTVTLVDALVTVATSLGTVVSGFKTLGGYLADAAPLIVAVGAAYGIGAIAAIGFETALWSVVGAFNAMKLAMLANPITAVLLGVTVLATAIGILTNKTEDNTAATKANAKAQADALRNEQFTKSIADSIQGYKDRAEAAKGLGNVEQQQAQRALDDFKARAGASTDLTLLEIENQRIKERGWAMTSPQREEIDARAKASTSDALQARNRSISHMESEIALLKRLAAAEAARKAAAAPMPSGTDAGSTKVDKAALSAAKAESKAAVQELSGMIDVLKLSQQNADQVTSNTEAMAKRAQAVRGYATELETAAAYEAKLAKAGSSTALGVLEALKTRQGIVTDPKATPEAKKNAEEAYTQAVRELAVRQAIAKAGAEEGKETSSIGFGNTDYKDLKYQSFTQEEYARAVTMAAEAIAKAKDPLRDYNKTLDDQAALLGSVGDENEVASYMQGVSNTLLSKGIDLKKTDNKELLLSVEALEKKKAKSLEELRVQSALADIYQSSVGKSQQLEARQVALSRAYGDGTINLQRYLTGLTDIRQESFALKALSGTETFADILSEAFDRNISSMTGALTEFVKTGKLSFSSMVDSMVNDLIRLQVQKSITTPLSNAISSSGGLGGIFSSIGSFFGFASGGYTGDMPATEVAGIVHGKEFVVDAQTTAMYRPLLEAMSAGTLKEAGMSNLGSSYSNYTLPASPVLVAAPSTNSGNTVIVQVIESPGKGGQQTRTSENGQDVLKVFVERIKSEVASDIRSGQGAVPAAISETFGVNRVAGVYS